MPPVPLLATLLVSAAASLQSPLEAIAVAFETAHPGTTITLNVGGSNALARQIENGAPADLLLTAGPIPDLPSVEKVPFLGNTLVLIASRETHFLTKITDLTHPRITTIAIANPATAPAGTYTLATLDHLDLRTTLEPALIYAKDVRQVLTYVATGNAQAGFVYATDVNDQVRLVTPTPEDSHPPITYEATLISNSPEAKAFLNLLLSESAQKIFKTQGFTPPVTTH